MSSRSLSSAQNRRATPQTQPNFTAPRGPQPSINSAQMFARQGQQQQQYTKNQQTQRNEQPSSQKRQQMSINHAITLITLRLGVLETKMINFEHDKITSSISGSIDGLENDNVVLIDNNVLKSITTRLESLEKRPANTATTNSNKEITLLKQQIESIKPSIIQTKTATINIVNENKKLKNQIENLQNELNELKQLISLDQEFVGDDENLENVHENLENVDENLENNNLLVEEEEEENTLDLGRPTEPNFIRIPIPQERKEEHTPNENLKNLNFLPNNLDLTYLKMINIEEK
jgi:hypothetical protein